MTDQEMNSEVETEDLNDALFDEAIDRERARACTPSWISPAEDFPKK